VRVAVAASRCLMRCWRTLWRHLGGPSHDR
jgi:hypothetical protein